MNMTARLVRHVAAVAFVGAFASANAALIRFGSDLDPEVLGATGSGSVTVDYDDVQHTLLIMAAWSGLSGTTTVAHIHCCVAPPGTAGVAVTPGTLPDFPVGVTAGTYVSPLIDLDLESSFTPNFLNDFGGGTVQGARSALLAAMGSATAYFNVHTTTYPGGEIRGFLQKVSEPATLPLLLAALGLLGFRRRPR